VRQAHGAPPHGVFDAAHNQFGAELLGAEVAELGDLGEVVAGAEVLDKIAAVPTGEKALKARSGESLREAPMQDVPNENVVIQSIKVVTE
jgi:hypothetical protein